MTRPSAPKVSDELAAAEVVDSDGSSRPLSTLWRTRPALILWVRHFG
jgi:hypothetical protein